MSVEPSKPVAIPFIIWTLQRTGGTNLATRLVERSGLRGVQHEPFNPGRIYGHITESWLHERDRSDLEARVREVVRKRAVIKHCVETVPWEVTEALARASSEAGYRHLFLYRRSARDRLLSLHFARQTGVWGPNMKAFKEITGAPEADTRLAPEGVPEEVLARPLPVAELVAHERRCAELLRRTWTLLRACGAEPVALAYEDLYRAADMTQRLRALQPVLATLGMPCEEGDLYLWIEELLRQGEQGTREWYARFPGVAELEESLQSIEGFCPERVREQLAWRAQAELPGWILRFFIDVLPSHAGSGQMFEVGGVTVVSREAPDGLELKLVGERGPFPLRWDLPSPRMAKEHPQARNAAHARWSGTATFGRNERSLTIIGALRDGRELALGEVLRSVAEDFTVIYREPQDRLIFDIGANDGADTWYYLRKGFRVVAVEPIPELAERLRAIYSAQVAAGRLFVEQVAIAAAPGTARLVVNEERMEWSSTHGAPKARFHEHRDVVVRACTLAALIERHGSPYFIKIDIEGGELGAVRTLGQLAASELPPYVSCEWNPKGREVLRALCELGYREFQLVRQGAPHLPAPPIPSREGLEYRCAFGWNMSGPFGRDLPEKGWVGPEDIERRLLATVQQGRGRPARDQLSEWYDVHARRPPEPGTC